MIPKAATELPEEISQLISLVGERWKEFNKNNLFDIKILEYWETLIKEWARDATMPLFVRKSRQTRGGIVIHKTKREIIFCDNTTAHWVAEKIFKKEIVNLQEIKILLEEDQIPFKFAPVKGEQENAKYKCISKNTLTKLGWKLCHIEGVRLKNARDVENVDIQVLEEHFIRFLNPKNFFMLPKHIGGLGEVNLFIEKQK
ncbi:hypothetical protein [Rufibacter ruber]|uniref:hypothetical protein n=1 Tax=Rufibacter ruber TaxID=1783499 RepID=UPI000831A123|nr:hypothetical protein [Rufibacter ruber]